jgi:ABC-type uncharacterized transport system substrate-binding protein
LAIRDTKGNAEAAEEAAKSLEREKVSLIYTTQTSITLAIKRATADTPIVFCAGADPVELGLVTSLQSRVEGSQAFSTETRTSP